jgi:hypothetical protein
MANPFGIHSVGSALMTYLRDTYPANLGPGSGFPSCQFKLFSSGELSGDLTDLGTALSLYLYRIKINEHRRNSIRPDGPSDSAPPLWVDLHYLMTVWADSALAEQTIMTWGMLQLHLRPMLDVSSLPPKFGWMPADTVQILDAELSDEDMMRIWDGIGPSYRLTVGYVARVVHVEPDEDVGVATPVVATRFDIAEGGAGR